MDNPNAETDVSLVAGNWLHPDEHRLGVLLEEIQQCIESRTEETQYHPVIVEFRHLIDTDAIVRMYITEMIKQIPFNPRYNKHHIKDVEQLLSLLNEVLTVAPDYNDTALVGTPFSAILIWTMGTPAGFAAYRNQKINAQFKKLLGAWQDFLNSKQSLYVINDSSHGWKSAAAQKKLQMQNYQYNPDDKHWGFHSWNDFFTRSLAPGARPIQEPDNNKVIVSSCDSTVYKISHHVKKYSEFWIKSQPYSLNDMLASDELTDLFIGGSVYQAFLNPFNYHRWHSPVAGKIVKAYVQEGLYFSQATSEGEDPTDQDHSEGYITQVQTRAIIFIECDDPAMGIVCVMPVGMVEISTCTLLDTIKPGHHLNKGDELGYFQFGGSTHCVLFQKGVVKNFVTKQDAFYQVGQMIAEAN